VWGPLSGIILQPHMSHLFIINHLGEYCALLDNYMSLFLPAPNVSVNSLKLNNFWLLKAAIFNNAGLNLICVRSTGVYAASLQHGTFHY
jgi:hypothetical protein